MDNIDANYIKEFDAVITKNKKDYVSFDQTAFYPMGGGQPSDIGTIMWEDKTAKISEVIKKGDTIKHITDGEKPPLGAKIHAVLDWNRRYAHMKMHTAQHIISGIVFDEYNARTVGNQIHSDYSRVDFNPAKFSDEDLENIKSKYKEIISRNLPVKIYEEDRSELLKRVDEHRSNLDLIPKHIERLRIVEIEDFDICPCAGTHVKNTSEIPEIKKIKKENKGKETDRVIYSFN